MGVGPGNRSSSRMPRRAWYPSGPWIDGVRPPESVQPATESRPKKGRAKAEPPTGNPDPSHYQLVKAEEQPGYLIVMIRYPNCTNYEGNKILVFKDLTLIQLVNQKLIDPHFFPNDAKFKSPIARFVPTQEGWDMAVAFIKMLGKP